MVRGGWLVVSDGLAKEVGFGGVLMVVLDICGRYICCYEICF